LPIISRARFPKFAFWFSEHLSKLRKGNGHEQEMSKLEPLFDLKSLIEFADCTAGTSNRRR
jgi:hypothetical protein